MAEQSKSKLLLLFSENCITQKFKCKVSGEHVLNVTNTFMKDHSLTPIFQPDIWPVSDQVVALTRLGKCMSYVQINIWMLLHHLPQPDQLIYLSITKYTEVESTSMELESTAVITMSSCPSVSYAQRKTVHSSEMLSAVLCHLCDALRYK